METIFHLPDTLSEDLSRFAQEVARFRTGSSSAAEFRAFRVPQGVYEQRESDTYMLRVRFPAGGVLPHQMRTLAAVSRKYGNGVPHVTTRQDTFYLLRTLMVDRDCARPGWIDPRNPRASLFLQAPLARPAGGGGKCDPRFFVTRTTAASWTKPAASGPACGRTPRRT